jgi:phage terminase Nu1 subunit (DNA packaging protein)
VSSDVRHLPVPEPERYLTRQQFADLFGCSVTTVDKMIGAGMPSVLWGKRVRRIRASEALAWVRDRQQAA